MIEQLNYTTTSKYNFPQHLQELDALKRLTKLSLSSMQNTRIEISPLYEVESHEPFIERLPCNELIDFKRKVFTTLITPLKPIRDGTRIVGIDTSSIRIGETGIGTIYAVRGAVVFNENRRYRYLRLGPFPFHITEENKREILRGLGKNSSSSLISGASPLAEAQSQLCNLIERWIQTSVSYSINKSIIVWDGSLTAGTPGTPISEVSQILNVARRNFNSVLAFSKATTMRFLGWRITDLVPQNKPPCLFGVEDLPLSISRRIHLLGKIHVAKLVDGGCSFRLDIDRVLPHEESIMAVERLLGNDIVFQGYPEVLRLAHIYSTFTANDVIGIQSYLTQEYGHSIISRYNIRKVLFGPYGTGFED